MKRELRLITDILRKQPHVLFAYLFGSRPKGFANERSDWDIAVYFKEPLEQRGHWPAFELEAEVSRATGSTVQVIVLNTPLPPVFGFEIVKDGILLIDRESNLRMEFENRILRQYHDWQYFLKRQMEADQKNVPCLSHKKCSSSQPQRRLKE